jgi:hypothetical protein
MNQTETLIMDFLLAGDHPILRALRKQLNHIVLESRTLTGYGFFLDFGFSAEVEGVHPHIFTIADVMARVKGLECDIGFMLFVRAGKIKFLECFSIDPLGDMPEILDLYYTKVEAGAVLEIPERYLQRIPMN